MNTTAPIGTNIKDEIARAKAATEKMKAARTRAEADHDNFTKRKSELEEEVRGLGVEPDKLQDKLQELRTNIQTNMAQIWSLIPEQYRS